MALRKIKEIDGCAECDSPLFTIYNESNIEAYAECDDCGYRTELEFLEPKEVFMSEREIGGYESDDVLESVNAYMKNYVTRRYHTNFLESIVEAVVEFLRKEGRPCANTDIHSMVMSIQENIEYLLQDRGKWLALHRE